MNIFHKVLNSKPMTTRRKELRRKTTESELVLWQRIRNNKLEYRFKRQYSVMNYVVDFYCTKAKLAIEIDGEAHIKNRIYDEYRTRYLESLGITELRFSNKEISSNIDGVLRVISKYLPSPKMRRGREGEV